MDPESYLVSTQCLYTIYVPINFVQVQYECREGKKLSFLQIISKWLLSSLDKEDDFQPVISNPTLTQGYGCSLSPCESDYEVNIVQFGASFLVQFLCLIFSLILGPLVYFAFSRKDPDCNHIDTFKINYLAMYKYPRALQNGSIVVSLRL